jgi:hypothetical protein
MILCAFFQQEISKTSPRSRGKARCFNSKGFGSQPTTMECNMILGTGIGQNSMTQNFFQHPAILIQKPGQWPVSCGSYWLLDAHLTDCGWACWAHD